MAESQRQTAKITLRSADGKNFIVDCEAAKKSKTIKRILDETGIVNVTQSIAVQNVPSEILKIIIQYLEHHKDMNESDDEDSDELCFISSWDEEFLKVDEPTLFQIIVASHYMEIDGLIEASSKTVARMITNKTPDEIRARFNIENDLVKEIPAENDHVENDHVENDDTKEVEVSEL